MSKIKLDLKDFKHVSSDDKCTVLQHKAGHQLTIAHKSLSKEAREQLDALSKAHGDKVMMAFGGDTGSKVPAPNGASENKEVTIKERARQMNEGLNKPVAEKVSAGIENVKNEFGALFGKANGGEVKMAEGGMATSDEEAAPEETPAEQIAKGQPVAANEVPMSKVAASQEAGEQLQQELQPKDNALQAVKDLYNAKLAASGVVATAADMFGPNGEPPKNPVNPSIWNAAENSDEAQKLAAQQISQREHINAQSRQDSQQQAEHDKALAQNAINAKLGIPLVPDPGAPQKEIAPDPRELAQDQTNVAPRAPASEGLGTQPATPPQAEPGMEDIEGRVMGGLAKEKAGILGQAQAQADLAKAQEAIYQQRVQSQQEAQDKFQQQYSDLNDERKAFIKDIQDAHINPEEYWTGHKDAQGNIVGGHSKIMSAIGLILAGFNPTNRPNAAMEMLKYQMDQNLEAQRQNLQSKQNLLAANLRQFGNLKDAVEMTRIMQNDMAVNMLQQAAAKAGSPMAKAQAQQAIGKLEMETAPMFQQFAMRRALINAANGGASPQSTEHLLSYLRVMNPEAAKEMESRFVPGVGLASVPVPQEVRQQMIGKQNFQAAIQDMMQWASQHSGSLSPSAIAEGKTKAANLQNLYREAINGGVFKQGEQHFIGSIIDSDPTKFFNSIRVMPKLQEAMRENAASLNTLRRGYGIQTQNAPAGQSAGPQVKVINGVKYMRGPNGEAIKIK
jgi:hypothetical protein